MHNNQYIEHQFLGSGGFSNVYKVSINEQVFALKKIYPYHLMDLSVRNAIMKEVHIMKQINHPNIIKFYDCIQNSENEVNLLLQYAEGGNLYNQLKIHQKLSQAQTIKYLKNIVKALKYLHSRPQPILHRDIKPQNILLTKSGECKLADFGSSNILDEQRHTFAGTKEYMAPEIVQNKPYGKQIDLWCLGVLVYELLIGTLPNEQGISNLPASLSRPAEDVIKRLLIKDPVLRMTLDELQNHIWFVSDSVYPPILQNQEQNQLQLRSKKRQSHERIQSLKSIKNKRKAINQEKAQEKDKDIEFGIDNLEVKNKQNGNEQSNFERQPQEHLEWIQLKSELKIKLHKYKQLITPICHDFHNMKMAKVEEQYNLQEKIRQYQNNITLLQRKYPLKFEYHYANQIRDFLKKTNHLFQYVDYLPTKLTEEVLDMPQHNTQIKNNMPLDDYIFKLKNYMLQCQRDALIQTITAKKRHKLFLHLQ